MTRSFGPAEQQFVKTVGMRLKVARKRAGMAQIDVAVAADVSHWAVCRWERGEYLPTLLPAMRLAEVLDVSLDWLVGRSKPK